MKIVCLGDSFTKGFGVREDENWLYKANKATTHTFVNKGINGDTTGGMLARFLRDVVEEKPNYVCITGGVNDFICDADLESVKSNIMAMAHQAYNYQIIPIIGIVPECIPDQARRDWASFTDFHVVCDKQKKYQKWILEFCKTFNVGYIDFYSQFPLQVKGELGSYYIDGLHLTPEGHDIIENIVEEAFKGL